MCVRNASTLMPWKSADSVKIICAHTVQNRGENGWTETNSSPNSHLLSFICKGWKYCGKGRQHQMATLFGSVHVKRRRKETNMSPIWEKKPFSFHLKRINALIKFQCNFMWCSLSLAQWVLCWQCINYVLSVHATTFSSFEIVPHSFVEWIIFRVRLYAIRVEVFSFFYYLCVCVIIHCFAHWILNKNPE